jgi:hypothetical protein
LRRSLPTPIVSSVFSALSCTSFSFRSCIKVLYLLWVDTCTGWKTLI